MCATNPSKCTTNYIKLPTNPSKRSTNHAKSPTIPNKSVTNGRGNCWERKWTRAAALFVMSENEALERGYASKARILAQASTSIS